MPYFTLKDYKSRVSELESQLADKNKTIETLKQGVPVVSLDNDLMDKQIKEKVESIKTQLENEFEKKVSMAVLTQIANTGVKPVHIKSDKPANSKLNWNIVNTTK
jgi:uncharacterized coiled-coil protein SlyX